MGKHLSYPAKGDGDFEATDQRVTPFQFLTPIDFRCIYAIGLNYREHAKETGLEIPKYPMVFRKPLLPKILVIRLLFQGFAQ